MCYNYIVFKHKDMGSNYDGPRPSDTSIEIDPGFQFEILVNEMLEGAVNLQIDLTGEHTVEKLQKSIRDFRTAIEDKKLTKDEFADKVHVLWANLRSSVTNLKDPEVANFLISLNDKLSGEVKAKFASRSETSKSASAIPNIKKGEFI